MRWLIFILLLTVPVSAPAMRRIDQTEQPVVTFKRIKKNLHKVNRSWFSFVGLALWIAFLAWFTSMLGWTFFLLFVGGCLALVFGAVFIDFLIEKRRFLRLVRVR